MRLSLSTIHEVRDIVTKMKHTGENAIKPEAIFSYTNFMNGVN